jgi:DNA-directed RNA polymerase subunit E'/Rpb7
MLKTIELNKTITVSPMVMDKNIINVISHMFKKKYEKSCDDKNGYIVTIHSIKDLQNIISKDSTYIQFSARLVADVIKPEIGVVFNITPSLIILRGIFGKLYDISILVPEECLKEKGWTFKDGIFINVVDDSKKIDLSSTISVKITNYKYAGSKYNCICEIVE